MLARRLDDLVVISFEPTQAFDQTPGPQAGAPLPHGPGADHERGTTGALATVATVATVVTVDPGTLPGGHTPLPGGGHPCRHGHLRDGRHANVAQSFPFFNKTRKNILASPYATVRVLHPVTAAFFRLHIRYLRTETSSGPGD